MDGKRPADRPAVVGRARARLHDALPLIAGLLAAAATFAVVAAGTDGDGAEPAGVAAAALQPGDPAAAGRQVFARMGCGTCHELAAANAKGQIGPNLDRRLPGHTRATLIKKIVDPYAELPPNTFGLMPENFGERMTAAELEALVTFLLAVRPDGPDG